MDFLIDHFGLEKLIKAGITIFLFILALNFIKHVAKKYFAEKMSFETKIVVSKITKFIWFLMLTIVLADQMDFSSIFKTILGTAGIVGIAIGFASKTSLENIISGLLLLSDNSLKINDTVLVDGIEGTILAIDSLSVKIMTYDNKLVRIPNVKILNSNVINLYPEKHRRQDFYFKISYKANLSKVEDILRDIAKNNKYAIKSEETYVYFYSFEDMGLKIKYGVWFEKGNITLLTNSITEEIKNRFMQEKIEIPVQLLNIEKTKDV